MNSVAIPFPPPSAQHELSAARQHLVRLMQELDFGRIERLMITDNEPLFDPKPRVVRIVALEKDTCLRPERSPVDFALKGTLRELFRHLDTLDSPAMVSITVQHGLPVRLTIEDIDPA